MAMQRQRPARLLTNFDVGDLPAYQKAIRRFGGRVRSTRLTIGQYSDCATLRGLYVAGPKKDLSRFWLILNAVRAEQRSA